MRLGRIASRQSWELDVATASSVPVMRWRQPQRHRFRLGREPGAEIGRGRPARQVLRSRWPGRPAHLSGIRSLYT
jgi:hypothetical protein